MSAFAKPTLPPFAHAVSLGLSAPQKYITSNYLYDAVGLKLFAAIAFIPQYGRALAEGRILKRHAEEISHLTGANISHYDLSHARSGDEQYGGEVCETPYRDWLEIVDRCLKSRASCDEPVMLTLPGGCFGNLDGPSRRYFLNELRTLLRPGDYFLFACDLLNSAEKMLAALDDGAGIVAALSKNLLMRVNRELGGHFDVRRFTYKAKWNAFLRRVEMHLVALDEHDVYVGALGQRFHFQGGESVHTGSFYKFAELEIEELAQQVGFVSVKSWIDIESSFAEVLWTI